MKIVICIGSIKAQDLVSDVLEYSISEANSIFKIQVERIYLTPEYAHCHDLSDNNFMATTFSSQRFLTAKITKRLGGDIGIYMDSDMLLLQNIDKVCEWFFSSKFEILISEPMPFTGQKIQTAFFMLKPTKTVLSTFDIHSNAKVSNKQEYVEFVNDFYKTLDFMLLDPAFNSRDYYSQETSVLHFTDLYRQPWISPFNNFSEIWYEYLEQYLDKHGRSKYIDAVKNKYIIDILNVNKFFWVWFLPLEFRIKFTKRLGKFVTINPFFPILALYIHGVGFYRKIRGHRST